MKNYLNYYDYVFKRRIYDRFAEHLIKIKIPLLISALRDYNNTNEFNFDRTHSGWFTKSYITINNAPIRAIKLRYSSKKIIPTSEDQRICK